MIDKTKTTIDRASYALFKDGKQVSKRHASEGVVVIEAYERSAIVIRHADMPGDKTGVTLAEGYEIRRLT